MKTLAFVPMRSGSKSILDKNIRKIAGRPLFEWSMDALVESSKIDEIVVSTDSKKYKEIILEYNSEIKVVYRSKESSKDEASTEECVLEFLEDNKEEYKDWNIFLVQITNPFLTSDIVSKAIQLKHDFVDSILSVVDITGHFIWMYNKPMNYDISDRPRRQDIIEEHLYMENGSIYLTSVENFLKYKNRLTPDGIGHVFMDKNTLFEIDEPEDFNIIEKILEERKNVSSTY
jgi:CMP-N-acetylneuraminic acid synthetase